MLMHYLLIQKLNHLLFHVPIQIMVQSLHHIQIINLIIQVIYLNHIKDILIIKLF